MLDADLKPIRASGPQLWGTRSVQTSITGRSLSRSHHCLVSNPYFLNVRLTGMKYGCKNVTLASSCDATRVDLTGRL